MKTPMLLGVSQRSIATILNENSMNYRSISAEPLFKLVRNIQLACFKSETSEEMIGFITNARNNVEE